MTAQQGMPEWPEKYSLSDLDFMDCFDRKEVLAEYEYRRAEAALARLRVAVEALENARLALCKVGDDYPGSSCHKWCHIEADKCAEALCEIGEVPA